MLLSPNTVARASMSRAWLATWITIIACLGASACNLGSTEVGAASENDVSQRETSAYVKRLLSLSPSPVVCAEAAASIALCERSLAEADPVAGLPEGPVDASEGIALRNGSMRVVLRGHLTSGAEFRSEIEVLRQDGEVLAVDPVYWVPRDVVG